MAGMGVTFLTLLDALKVQKWSILLKNYLLPDSRTVDGASRALLWSLLREKSFHVTVRAVVPKFQPVHVSRPEIFNRIGRFESFGVDEV